MGDPAASSNKRKVLIVMSIAVFFAALGDISLSRGMKMISADHFPTLQGQIVATVTNAYVLLGVLFLMGFAILYLVSLSWEDLSYVLPLTGAIYILVTIFAFVLLHEDVSVLRVAGSALVAAGIVVVARS